MPRSYIVAEDYNDSRLDKWFKNEIINLPHSLLEKILRQNKVKVNKKSNWVDKLNKYYEHPYIIKK